MSDQPKRLKELKDALSTRILVLDGSWAATLQEKNLQEEDFAIERAEKLDTPLKGNYDVLCLTRPEIVSELHDNYFEAGADIATTNTFTSTNVAQEDYGLESKVREINLAAARLARNSADKFTAKTPTKPRWVAGSMGPLNKSLSIATNVNKPAERSIAYDEVHAAYTEQAIALYEGGVDFYLFETIFDTLNVKAGIKAILDLEDRGIPPLPIWISGTISDKSGRILSGQTLKAFWISVMHARPFAMGLNCALGAETLRPHVEELSRYVNTNIAAYPNAGLPNEFGNYVEEPHETAAFLEEWAKSGLVNIVGGCCGTTPDHIAAISDAVDGLRPRFWGEELA